MEEKKRFNFAQKPGAKLNRITGDGKEVSIISTLRNLNADIKSAFISVLNQTFPYYEWIIVADSALKADLEAVISDNNLSDDRIKIIYTENLSAPQMISKAFSSATCSCVFTLDFTAILDKTVLETMYWALTLNKSCKFVYSNYVEFGEKNKLHKKNIKLFSLLKEPDFLFSFMAKKQDITDDFYTSALKLYQNDSLFYKLSFYGVWYKNRIALDSHKKYDNINQIKFPRSGYYNYTTEPFLFDWNKKFEKYQGPCVLCVCPWAVVGGADIFNLNMFKGLKEKGYRIILVTTNYHEYELRQEFELVVDEFFDLTSFLSRKQWPGYIDYLIKTRNIDMIMQLSSVYFYHLIPWLKNVHPDIPVFDYLHAIDFSWRNGGFPKDSIAVSKFIDKTYTCTESLKTLMYQELNRTEDNVQVEYIGVDADYFNPDIVEITDEKLIALCKNKKVLLLPSRLSGEKRPIFLLYLAKKIYETRKDFVCLVVGHGPEKELMQTYIKQLSLENVVHLLGMKKDLRQYYKASDVTIICSLSEGLTLTTYESLSMGVSVVSADVGGQKELIDEKCGSIIKCYQDIKKDMKNYNYDEEELNEYKNAILKIFDGNNDKNYLRNKILKGYSQKILIDNIDRDIRDYIKTGSRVNRNYCNNIELAIRYLVLFNELSKEAFFTAAKLSPKERIKQTLWNFKLWRAFVFFTKRMINSVKRNKNAN